MTASPTEPFSFSAAEAAVSCGVSKKTIQRKIVQLEAAGAWKDERGEWRMTPQQLRDVKLYPGKVRNHDPFAPLAAVPDLPTPAAAAPSSTLIELAVAEAELRTARIRIADQERELQVLREERSTFQAAAKAAEAVAQEREYVINDLRLDRKAVIDRLSRRTLFGRRRQITAGPTLITVTPAD